MILVAEKLLQRTAYGHVLNVYEDFIERFPNTKSLGEVGVSDIEKTIRRLGLQRRRAVQLKTISLTILNKYGGEIPSNREDLLKLHGIGDYVANAILCFAFGQDIPVVDVNVRRVVSRYFGWKKLKDKKIEKRLSNLIPKGKGKQFNLGMIDFSALICSRKPKCRRCFLSDLCVSFQQALEEPTVT